MSRVILITGSRKGIGRHLAGYYLEKGFIVIGCSRTKTDLVHENYRHYTLDVVDEVAVGSMVREASRQFGGIDVLLNNAGVASMNHMILTPISTVRNIFETNFFGTFIFVREVSKIMMKRKRGCIVNFVSVASPLRLEGEAVYASSKTAVLNFTEIAARELGGFGITVNAIGPTPVETDLIRGVPKHKLDSLIQKQAIKRMGTYQDISNVVDFLIDERSSFITGQIIYLGGIHSY